MVDRQKLFKIWLLTILVLLITIFYELVAEFDLSDALYWVRILIVLMMIIFTFYIVYTKDNKRGINREKWYADEILRRDKIIEDLRKENNLIVKTSLKQSENAAKWSEYAKRLEKQK